LPAIAIDSLSPLPRRDVPLAAKDILQLSEFFIGFWRAIHIKSINNVLTRSNAFIAAISLSYYNCTSISHLFHIYFKSISNLFKIYFKSISTLTLDPLFYLKTRASLNCPDRNFPEAISPSNSKLYTAQQYLSLYNCTSASADAFSHSRFFRALAFITIISDYKAQDKMIFTNTITFWPIL
jgi:hypothetical protein